MTRTTAMQAYAAAQNEFADQVAQLHQMIGAQRVDDPGRINWAAVGSLQAHVAALREVTDQHYGHGEYASTPDQVA